MLRRRKAIIEQTPGVTRDRLYAQIRLNDIDFVLIDTGGITQNPKDKISHLVYQQSREALKEADGVLFVCDIISGITYQDEHISKIIKKSNKQTFLVINKVDNERLRSDIYDFYKLGLGDPYAVSALHTRGFQELYKALTQHLRGLKRSAPKGDPGALVTKLAVVGRPNVGKSSFVNCLLDQERLLVDATPGTTRDSVDTHLRRNKDLFILIDTAGIKHKRKLRHVVEVFSMARTKESIRRCDIALVMIDINEGLIRDDIAVMDYVLKKGRACLLLANKVDIAKDIDLDRYRRLLIDKYRPLEWIPTMFISCKNRQNIIKALDRGLVILRSAAASVPTPKLNALFEKSQSIRPHPRWRKTSPKIYYGTQIGTLPPKFLLFVSDPERISKEYLRYIERRIRKAFGFQGLPIFFELRTKVQEA